MELFLSANIHQGNDLFSVYSRGKQCAFMCLSALLTARNNRAVWSKTTLNNVLLQAWALTIHKSHGLTLPKAWIDILENLKELLGFHMLLLVEYKNHLHPVSLNQ